MSVSFCSGCVSLSFWVWIVGRYCELCVHFSTRRQSVRRWSRWAWMLWPFFKTYYIILLSLHFPWFLFTVSLFFNRGFGYIAGEVYGSFRVNLLLNSFKLIVQPFLWHGTFNIFNWFFQVGTHHSHGFMSGYQETCPTHYIEHAAIPVVGHI